MESNSAIRNIGMEKLEAIAPRLPRISDWKSRLANYQFDDTHPDDAYVWLTCVVALEGLNTDNYGVGSILIDDTDKVVSEGHNEVFHPYFRSDRHAEMVVLERFEGQYHNTSLKNYTLYTSDEPCPMCFTRLIVSGVGKVLYASPDITSGMVHKMKDLPLAYIELARRQVFAQADCSQDLIGIANQILLYNSEELDEKLYNH